MTKSRDQHYYQTAEHWQTFKSPIKVDLNFGQANILVDWNRLTAPVYINGKTVQAILKEDRGLAEEPKCPDLFANKEELEEFFNKHFLKNVPAEHKAHALNYLMICLQQGALLNPVSSVAYSIFNDLTGGELGPAGNFLENGKRGQVRHTAFIVDEDGFSVQEIVHQNRLIYMGGEHMGESVYPDKGNDFVYKAQATIKVTFPSLFNPAEDKYIPEIAMQSSSINYGNKLASKVLDDRNWLEKIIDVIKKVIGKHKVNNLVHTGSADKPAEIEMQELKPKKP